MDTTATLYWDPVVLNESISMYACIESFCFPMLGPTFRKTIVWGTDQ